MYKQQTVRTINAHLATMRGYCYVFLKTGEAVRITRARTRKGVKEGRVLGAELNTWIVIPQDATIELS